MTARLPFSGCAARDGQPLSKLKADGLSARKWTKLLITVLQDLVDCLCRLHCMMMYLWVCTSTLPHGHLKDKFRKNL